MFIDHCILESETPTERNISPSGEDYSLVETWIPHCCNLAVDVTAHNVTQEMPRSIRPAQLVWMVIEKSEYDEHVAVENSTPDTKMTSQGFGTYCP